MARPSEWRQRPCPSVRRLSQRVPCSVHEGVVGGPSVPPRHELHVHRGCIDIARPLRIHEQLLHERGKQLSAGLALPRADQNGSADLVEDRRCALLVRWVDDVGVESIDRGQFFLPTIESQLTCVVNGSDGRCICEIHGRESPRER